MERQEIELKIIKTFLEDAAKEGYYFTVDNGEEIILRTTQDIPLVMANVRSVDDELLYFSKKEGHKDYAKMFGWVRLVYGNSGWDVITDNTTNLEPIMERVDHFIDEVMAAEA
jgi:hypothetical protein